MSKKPRFLPRPRTVLIVLFPGFQIVDAAGPIGAFEVASRLAGGAYKIRAVASLAGPVPSSSGVSMLAGTLGRAKVDTFVVVGGHGTQEALRDPALLRAIARAPGRARRVASVCSGAFLLAQAGLLNGRRGTTHWRYAALLAGMFPEVRVEPDCIYVKDGQVWTSAGVTAGIDLALAMIAEDLGEDLAADVAREMVVYAKRPGGQAQHSALLDLSPGASRFAPLNAWMREHLREDLAVERLAAQAAMSPRNFARAYTAEVGVTPAKAVERLRAEAARTALAGGGALQEIAQHTGFGDPERMRRAFVRIYGTPPAAMRRTLRRT